MSVEGFVWTHVSCTERESALSTKINYCLENAKNAPLFSKIMSKFDLLMHQKAGNLRHPGR